MSTNHQDQLQDAMFRKKMKGQTWGELEILADKVRNQIGHTSILVNDIDKDVQKAGTSNPEYEALAIGVMRDLHSYSQDFANQYERHKGKNTPFRDANDYTEYFDIGMNYTRMTEEFQTVVANVVFSLTEHHNHAKQVLLARQANDVEGASEASSEAKDEQGPAIEVSAATNEVPNA